MANSKTLVIERVFDAPVEQVWAAVTEPEEIKKWWGPTGFTAPVAKVDLKVGGHYLFAMHGPAGTEWDKDMFSGGEYKVIVPLKKIVVTDSFMDKDGNKVSPTDYGMPANFPQEQQLTLTFETVVGSKTKLTITHEGFPEGEDVNAKDGWNQSLDKLAAAL